MASSPEDLARSLGFINPRITTPPLLLGAKFRVHGELSNGMKYDFRYEIVGFKEGKITLRIDGAISGRNIIDSNWYTFNFVPNVPFELPAFIVGLPKVHIAFISNSAKEFRPAPGQPIIIAHGEVRDTVPPPPPKY